MPASIPPPKLRAHSLARVLPLAAVGIVAAMLNLNTKGRIQQATSDSIAQALSNFSGCPTQTTDFIWEPSCGRLMDLWVGRPVLYLCGKEGERDLYRGRVRIAPNGVPLSVAHGQRLTQTPATDESDLVATAGRAAVLQRQNKRVVAARIIDLRSDAPQQGTPIPWWQRKLSNWLRYAATQAPQQAQLLFDRPIAPLRAELDSKHLRFAVGKSGTPLALRLADMRLLPASSPNAKVKAWRWPEAPMGLAQLGRALVQATLPAPLQSVASSSRTKSVEHVAAQGLPARPQATTKQSPRFPPKLEPATQGPVGAGTWRPLSTGTGTEESGPRSAALMRQKLQGPDGAAARAIELVAIDTRRVELGFKAGYLSPRVRDFAQGSGLLPKHTQRPILAVFNALTSNASSPQDDQSLRLVLNGRPRGSLRKGAATLGKDRWGNISIFSWPSQSQDVEANPWLVQQVNFLAAKPTTAKVGKEQTRSALCRSAQGPLIYAWSQQSTEKNLLKAMRRAGCTQAFPLATGAERVAFSLASAGSKDKTTTAALHPQMSRAAQRLWQQAPHGVFFLRSRNVKPQLPKATTQALASLKEANTKQPSPSWLPAIHRAHQSHQGAAIDVWAFSIPRFRWSLVPGSDERIAKTTRHQAVDKADARPFVRIGLGRAKRRRRQRYGLVIDGMTVQVLRPERGLISTLPRLEIEIAVPHLAPRGDASELLLIAENGRIRSEGRELAARKRRSAACITGDRRFLVAIGTSDNDEPLAQSLLNFGCRRIVRLNRGKQVEAFVHLRGSKSPPKDNNAQTTLVAFASDGSIAPGARP